MKKSLVAIAMRELLDFSKRRRKSRGHAEVVEKEEEYDANGVRGRCWNREKGRDDVRACRSRSVPASLATWWTPFGLFLFSRK